MKDLKQLHELYDKVWDKPPKDVFYKSVNIDGDLITVEKDGKIVSSCILKENGGVVEIINVVTDPDYRKDGHASDIMLKVLDENKGKVLILWTRIPSFFEKFGFNQLFCHGPKYFMAKYNEYHFF